MSTDFDAVIIGAGAGGGVAAYVLAARGWKVALVDKGRNPFPTLGDPVLRGSLFGNDELKRHRRFAWQDPVIEPRLYRDTADGAFEVRDFQALGVGIGGGTLQYDANSPRVQRADLRLKSTFGAVAGADVVDWPIAYEDLEPWYDEAERLIGVQGLEGADPFAEPRRPYPMPPGYPSRADIPLAAAAASLGYHPHPMPTAVNSIFYRGRPACANCGFCNVGCPINAKGSTAVTVIRDALRTGNCTILPETCVTGIDCEPSGGHATGVRVLDATGAKGTITARHVMVACNAIETPRLLLESASSAWPAGLGNASGLVGKYLMFHVVFNVIATFKEDVKSYRGRCITKAMADFTVSDGSPDYVRGGYLEFGGQTHPVGFGGEFLSDPRVASTRLMVLGFKDLLVEGTNWKRLSALSMMGEDVPVVTNRVELDPGVRDVYGRPVPRVTYVRHPHDQAMVDRYTPKMRAIVEAAGATPMEQDMAAHFGAPETKHLLGTTRMGTDAATSVCDPWGRLHGVDNVWIADGSTWPTSTAFNPVLTQQALAYRTAAYMVAPGNPVPVDG